MKKIIISLITTAFLQYSFTPLPVIKYTVDKQKSVIAWTGKKITGQHNGNVELSSGYLLVGNKKIQGGEFEINLASISVSDLTDQNSKTKLLSHLKSDDFFSVEKFPVSKLVISNSKFNGKDNYEITGNLTIKGITNPVTFPAVIKIKDKTITAWADITINRTKFGIKFRSAGFFENLGDKVIDDDFILHVTLIATN
jgi:polyisoprenoid-binding protein YceI